MAGDLFDRRQPSLSGPLPRRAPRQPQFPPGRGHHRGHPNRDRMVDRDRAPFAALVAAVVLGGVRCRRWCRSLRRLAVSRVASSPAGIGPRGKSPRGRDGTCADRAGSARRARREPHADRAGQRSGTRQLRRHCRLCRATRFHLRHGAAAHPAGRCGGLGGESVAGHRREPGCLPQQGSTAIPAERGHRLPHRHAGRPA